MSIRFFLKDVFIACIFTAMLLTGGCDVMSKDAEDVDDIEEQQEIREISREEALEIAAKEIETFPEEVRARLEGVKPEVRREENIYIVTYPTDWPEGVLGADYHFQFVIDARTGEIIRRLKGS